MRDPLTPARPSPRHRPWAPAALAVGTLLAAAALARAADEPKHAGHETSGRRVPVAELASADGSLVARQGSPHLEVIDPAHDWKPARKGDKLYSEDVLLAVPFAHLAAKDGTLRLDLLADYEWGGPYPIIETAVILHESRHADLDLTLDRGRVQITNQKTEGHATARVRFRDEVWDLTLHQPGDAVTVVIFGRWLPGMPFTKEPRPDEKPALDATVLAVKGHVTVKHAQYHFRMSAPPGPALFHWDSIQGADEHPQYLKELPAWGKTTDPAGTPEGRRRLAAVNRLRRLILDKPLDDALDEFSASDDPAQRRGAIFAMAALGRLKKVGQVLAASKSDAEWNYAVVALRHCIGCCPGQDQRLYGLLIKNANFPPVQAETVLQLLHGFGEQELSCPECYELLIDYLKSDKLAIRGLAHWHLVRLAPAGRSIPYSPNASPEEQQKAWEAWKKLIPTGQLPPKPKVEQ